MEGVSFIDGPLDYAAFKFFPEKKRCELFICHQGITERVSEEYLEQIISQIPSAKNHFDRSNEIFKLQLAESLNKAHWFTKRTLGRFSRIVGASELLEHAFELEHEMSQLEQTRRFHLALYAEGDGDHSLRESADRNCQEGLTQAEKSNVMAAFCDATKNELLRAMDVRLAALREELTSTLDQAADGPCSFQELADLLEFAQNFASTNLKNLFLKYFALSQHSQATDVLDKHSTSLQMDSVYGTDNGTSSMNGSAVSLSASSSIDKESCSRNIVSPAKIAQAEIQMPIDSEESLDSSDEHQTHAERSRPMLRSASPRRSASPMRRIQIGRSGSRRSTALTIKSLGFYPARERIPTYNREIETNSEDEEPTEMPKQPESSARSFSVQDAINLFESKQRDLSSEIQQRRASAEAGASFINTKKSVLRRWSAGMGDSSTKCTQENTSEGHSENIREDYMDKSSSAGRNAGIDPPASLGLCSGPGYLDTDNAFDMDGRESVRNGTTEVVKPNVDETHEHEIEPAEWDQKKETELKQMLLQMMEKKPAGSQHEPEYVATQASVDLLSEQKVACSERYKEKSKARLREQNAGKKAEKDVKLKKMQDDLERRKVEVAGKSVGGNVKQNQLGPTQKLLRNSSPSGLPKHEILKPMTSKKAPLRASPVSATRRSMSSVALPRTSITPTKASITLTSTSNVTNRKKVQPAPSPTKTTPKKERSQVQLPKTNKRAHIEGKANLKGKDDMKQSIIRKTNVGICGAKTGVSADDSRATPAKPSFYSKVTTKGSVVPLETKPFLRKGMGIGRGVGPAVVKTNGTQHDDSSKTEVNVTQVEDLEAATVMVNAPHSPECNESDQVKGDASETEQCESFQKKIEIDNIESDSMDPLGQLSFKTDECIKTEATLPVETPINISQTCTLEDVTDLIWVEMDEQEKPLVSEITPVETAVPTVAELPIQSPRVHHSLSQMLQADNGEPEIVNEWGNAENPPALVYQKDSPRGFKRLLKFGRKSRGGDGMATGSAGSAALSEGEDDNEEPKGTSKRNIDALLRRSAPHIKGFEQQKIMLGQSRDYAWTKRSNLSNAVLPSPKLRQDQNSATAASAKATRSFFSLSTFKSKGSEAKLR